MRRNDAITAAIEQPFENRLGNGAADRRLGSRTELVDQHQRAVGGSGQHVLHVAQVRRIGRQIVVDRLLVADIDADRPENGQLRDLRRRHGITALEEILHKPRRLQADRLAAGIGSRNHEDALVPVEHKIERHDLAPLRPQRLLQQRMARRAQFQPVVRREDRLAGVVSQRPARFGADHIDGREIVARIGDQLRIGTDRLGEGAQHLDHFAPLGVFQLLEFIVDFDHLDRLDIEGTARGRLVVNESLQLAFVDRCNRDHRPPVTHRQRGVGLDDAGLLGSLQHLLQPFGSLPFAFTNGTAHLL